MRVVELKEELLSISEIDERHSVLAKINVGKPTFQWLQLQLTDLPEHRREFQWCAINAALISGYSGETHTTIEAAIKAMMALTPEVHAFVGSEAAMRHYLTDMQAEYRSARPSLPAVPAKPAAQSSPAPEPALSAKPAEKKVASKPAKKKRRKARRGKPGPKPKSEASQ